MKLTKPGPDGASQLNSSVLRTLVRTKGDGRDGHSSIPGEPNVRLDAGVLGMLGMAGFVLTLVTRVRAGCGLEPYISMMGYETNAVQVLATMTFLAICFGVATVVVTIRKRRS